jgi:hypothetical protein
VSSAAAEFIFSCGILDFNTLFWSDHNTLYIAIDIIRILRYPVSGTIQAMEHDLKLNDPHLIDAYQSTLFQQLLIYTTLGKELMLFTLLTHLYGPHIMNIILMQLIATSNVQCIAPPTTAEENRSRNMNGRLISHKSYTKSVFGAYNEE